MAGRNDVAQAFNGKPKITGGVRMAELGTPLPTDARTALDDIFDQPGYISEDGLVETPERSTDKKKAWGGQTVKVIQTEYSVQYQFTFLQPLNPVVLRAVHGDQNVTTIEATADNGNQTVTKLNADTLPHKVWVFDMKDGQALKRICVPDGQITEVGETNYQDEELAGYEVTLEAFYVEEYDANAIRYTDDGKFAIVGTPNGAVEQAA